MRSIRNHLILVAAGLATLTTGCATASRRSAPSNAVTTVNVRNNNFYDMNVYAITDAGVTMWLGFARGEATTKLTVPAWVIGGAASLRMAADPVGSTSLVRSDLLNVMAGDTITFTIEQNTSLSMAVVRAR